MPDDSRTQVLKISLSTFTLTSALTLGMNVANVILFDGSFMYVGGADTSGNVVIQKRDRSTLSLVASLSPFFGEISCGAMDSAGGHAYFGTLNGWEFAVNLASFTVDYAISGRGIIRSLAVDTGFVYAALPPATYGGTTWWLEKRFKDLTSPAVLTDPTWTSGSGTIQGAKTLMIL